jgi:hypothetical protein
MQHFGCHCRLLDLLCLPDLCHQLRLAVASGLAELSRARSCCMELARRGGVPVVLQLLRCALCSQSEAYAAHIVVRLAAEEELRKQLL